MIGFTFGLLVAFGGALLLAAGSELQSQAVFLARGRWRAFLRSRSWLGGLGLLAVAVSTNFVALALTPVSAVQSVSVAALAASTAYGALTRRVAVDRRVYVAVALCMIGVVGFIVVLATHPGRPRVGLLEAQLVVVVTVLDVLTVLGLLTVAFGAVRVRHRGLISLVIGAMTFGSITTVFKVLVALVLRDGLTTVLRQPLSLWALTLVVVAGVTANILLQRAHRAFPAPVVVASLTVIDPLTAAVVGITVLGEAALTPGATIALLVFGTVAVVGVGGLSRLRRAPSRSRSAVVVVSAPASVSDPHRRA